LVEAKLALRRARIRVEAVNWIPPSNWIQRFRWYKEKGKKGSRS